MAWNDDPKVRDLAKWANKHGYKQVIAIVFTDNKAGYVSYGKTKKLCDTAKDFGDQIVDDLYGKLIMNEARATAKDAKE